jgi:malonyl CoA-acyl carrier protein transacylase
MQPQGPNPLKQLLQKTEIQRPKIPTYSNVTGKPYQSENEIINLLSEQFYKPCKWEQIIHNLYSTHSFDMNTEVLETYETGPSKQLGVFLKSANGKAYKYYISLENEFK